MSRRAYSGRWRACFGGSAHVPGGGAHVPGGGAHTMIVNMVLRRIFGLRVPGGAAIFKLPPVPLPSSGDSGFKIPLVGGISCPCFCKSY